MGNNMSPLLQWYLGTMNPSQQPTPADISRTQVGPQGAGSMNPSSAGGQGPTPSAQSGLPEGSQRGSTTGGNPSNDVQGPTIPAVSGVNDVARQVPLIGGYLS